MIRKELVLDIQYQSPYNTEKQHTILPTSFTMMHIIFMLWHLT